MDTVLVFSEYQHFDMILKSYIKKPDDEHVHLMGMTKNQKRGSTYAEVFPHGGSN